MARWPKVSAYEFERHFNGLRYTGEAFFDNREQCKAVAKETRNHFQISARVVVIPESYTSGGHYGGYLERYILMLPDNQEIPQNVIDYIHQQAKKR